MAFLNADLRDSKPRFFSVSSACPLVDTPCHHIRQLEQFAGILAESEEIAEDGLGAGARLVLPFWQWLALGVLRGLGSRPDGGHGKDGHCEGHTSRLHQCVTSVRSRLRSESKD
jgi:hypothetical protein